ncbi:MAG TPA: ROK family protein [Arsenicitalea sp.]|jgi:N-acetylglucosamine kinase|nr:ROK family protein [Arsenicitalea sp.]
MVLCADIGGSFIKCAAADEAGALSNVQSVPTPANDWGGFVAALAGLTGAARPGVEMTTPLAIAIAGLVDPDTGVITSANIPCLNGRALGPELEQRLGRPVLVVNDADAFALAEAGMGAGRGHRVVFGVILGTGVGGGLVVEGRLVRGAFGITGEWGHGPIAKTKLDTDGLTIPRFACGCGQYGCVDSFGGARGLERLHNFLSGRKQDSHAIIEDWQAGDPDAYRTMRAYIEMLSEPLALAINVCGASIVPVGGGLGSVPALIEALDEALGKLLNLRPKRAVVVPAQRVKDAGLVGAAVLGSQGRPA